MNNYLEVMVKNEINKAYKFELRRKKYKFDNV